MQTVLAWDYYTAEAERSASVQLPVGKDFARASATANTTSEASIPQPRSRLLLSLKKKFHGKAYLLRQNLTRK